MGTWAVYCVAASLLAAGIGYGLSSCPIGLLAFVAILTILVIGNARMENRPPFQIDDYRDQNKRGTKPQGGNDEG